MILLYDFRSPFKDLKKNAGSSLEEAMRSIFLNCPSFDQAGGISKKAQAQAYV